MRGKKSRAGARAFSGVMDVIGVAVASLVIVILLLMLSSLFSWLKQDLAATFGDLTENIAGAVVISGK